MESPMLGMILPWPVSFAPQGWLLCQGQELPINQYNALYSLLGLTFGGSATTFKLPDLRGRTIVGAGQRTGGTINYTAGMFGGNEFTTATLANLPYHNHQAVNTVTGGGTLTFTIKAKNTGANTNTPSATSYAAIAKETSGKTYSIYNNDTTYTPDVNMPGGTITIPTPTVATAISYTGTGNQMTTVSPFLAMNYIIATEGLYPVRP